MPRRARFCPSGLPVHVIQRGNNRQAIFASETDFAAFANWLAEGAARFGVAVHGWVFMTNHVHLLVTPSQDDSVSRLMQLLGRLYVRYFNNAYSRSGALFEGRFRASVVQENRYFLTCLRYIELNPVRAGMVAAPGDYHWSSYNAHALGVRARMWTPHALYLNLGKKQGQRQQAWRALVDEGLDIETLVRVRQCANAGLILGSEKFREQVSGIRS